MPQIIELNEANLKEFVTDSQQKMRDSHAVWHEHVNSTKFTPPEGCPDDPFSQDYLNFQLDIWKLISKRKTYHEGECEKNEYIAIAPSIKTTYPFSTGNPAEVGRYFGGISNIFRHLEKPPGSTIVEYGVGYGHLTRMLADGGYDVTAVDIEERFLSLLHNLQHPGAAQIKTVHDSFVGAQFPSFSVDAFIFFECFHHCLEHEALIASMSKALKPDGVILFAAEAFYDDWFDYPWGLRLDGHSVWAINQFHWMELGFRKTYMETMLARYKFKVEWSSVADLGAYGEMLVARRSV